MKEEIIIAFVKYLQDNGFEQVKFASKDNSAMQSDTSTKKELSFEPDISAKNEGVSYYYK